MTQKLIQPGQLDITALETTLNLPSPVYTGTTTAAVVVSTQVAFQDASAKQYQAFLTGTSSGTDYFYNYLSPPIGATGNSKSLQYNFQCTDGSTHYMTMAAGHDHATGSEYMAISAVWGGGPPYLATIPLLINNGNNSVVVSPSNTSFNQPPTVPSYTLSTLPTAIAGGMCYVTNANSGNGALCYSDGSIWRDCGTHVLVI